MQTKQTIIMTNSEIPEAIYQNVDNEGCLELKTRREKHQPLQLTGSVSVKSRKQRAVEVCLGLLCALLLTAVIVLCVYFSIQRKHLLTHITELNEDQEQLLNQNNDLTEEREQILKHNNDLTEERDKILKHNDDLTKERDKIRNEQKQLHNWLHEQDQLADNFKWIYYSSSFYYISFEKKSWSDSRRDCQQRKADLVIAKRTGESTFLKKVLQNNSLWVGWRQTNGDWKWIDDPSVANGFGSDSLNCAVVSETKYFSYACNTSHGWICERTNINP
ncbi:C-type lectin domain family 12 member B-like [Danio aesculapii]|uniref:C-type lectin domain family 12 member B-like n=1 Tax=Danio aesculapii TaxID=1142201 RepID=UPI0024BF5B0E|nr:C-type lectin domain family 12 member B-like [Danio aesculapii]